jgi:phage gp16-like protein
VEKDLGNGPRFRYRCAEDDRQKVQRSGKAEGKEGKGTKTRHVFPCQLNLEFNFDVWQRRVTLILRHHHLHNTYVDRRLGEKAKQHILECAKADGRAKAIRRDLRKQKAAYGRATQGQVKHLLSYRRGRKVADSDTCRYGTGWQKVARRSVALLQDGRRRRNEITLFALHRRLGISTFSRLAVSKDGKQSHFA